MVKLRRIRFYLQMIRQGRLPHLKFWVEWHHPEHIGSGFTPWINLDDLPF